MQIDEQELYATIGARLQARRRELGLTQGRLAERVEVERTSITNAEGGRQRLPLHLLYRLCGELDLEIASLLPPVAAVATAAQDGVEVSGYVGKMPPKAASLVRELSDRLSQG